MATDGEAMGQERLRQLVDKITDVGLYDDEAAHAEEDKLHLALIEQFCPEWVRTEVARLGAADFTRWCA